jgi:hypothetical protein
MFHVEQAADLMFHVEHLSQVCVIAAWVTMFTFLVLVALCSTLNPRN